MARPLRINAPGVTFHLIARGNAREVVCVDHQDRRLFLELFEHAEQPPGTRARTAPERRLK